MSGSEILVLGKIQGPRGIHGDLKVIRRGDILDGLKKNSVLELYSSEGLKDGFLINPVFFANFTLQSFAVLNNDTAQLRLKELKTPEEAEKLKGLFIGIRLAEAKTRFHNPEDPYLFEYLGLDIYEGDSLKGKVVRVEQYNSKQWLIGLDKTHEVMIPLQGPFIGNVDFTRGVVSMVPESGLFSPDEPQDEIQDEPGDESDHTA